MNNNVKLSIVVLSYNNAQYINDCLSSLERQNVDSYEVFIIDDSSTDNSVEVINEYIKNKPQFHLIQKPNSGGAISSQIGISKATGKYCALVDSDDVVADGAYAKLIARIEQDDSDFASGLPMRMANGFMQTFLASNVESNIFVENRVLSTDEELESFTKQVFYWNSVYKTDFLKNNSVEMPANLLIADRIFVYKAVMYAKKISILNDVVYFWRKKENSDKMSLTDQTAEFHMIADRCDSFQAQIKLCIQDFQHNLKYNKAIWEHSFMRMYYPLYTIANPENEEKGYPDFVAACDRYRCFLLQYKGFFTHLIANSDIPINAKYITERILTKHYKQLFNFIAEKKTFADLNVKKLDTNVYNSLLRNTNNLSVNSVTKDGDRTFLNFQILLNIEDDEFFSIDEVFVYNRYFNQKRIDLSYDAEERRVDITDLPAATYIVNTICTKGNEKLYYTPQLSEELSKTTAYDLGDKIITFNSRFSILTIQKKNRFTVLRDGSDYLLGINYPNDVKEIFFFNVNENRRIPLKKKGNLYCMEVSSLPKGDNVLLYRTDNDLYTTVRKNEFSNSFLDQDIFDALIVRGKIEIEVE